MNVYIKKPRKSKWEERKMKKMVIDGFELNQENIKELLSELQDEGVNSEKDLEVYFKGHKYMKDESIRSHLLLSPSKKKRNFAIPFDENN